MSVRGDPQKPTPRQREYLDFIAGYAARHGHAPAEVELAAHFQVTPASVHAMIVALDRRGLITRRPGVPRSILLVEQVAPAASTCLFCAIAAGRTPSNLVWTSDAHVAFLDVNPAARGHLLLVPRRHAATIYDLARREFAALFEIVRRLGPALASAVGADRAAVAVEGYGVAHAHVHLVPVSGGGQLDPCKQRPAGQSELRAAATKIRAELASVR
jgi:histidine triad (HIT) family protein